MKTLIEYIDTVDPKNAASVRATASALVEGLAPTFKVGDSCIILDDPAYPYSGQKGKVKSGLKGNGYYDVQLADGRIVPLIANQLLRV